jgi:hypothetical protein
MLFYSFCWFILGSRLQVGIICKMRMYISLIYSKPTTALDPICVGSFFTYDGLFRYSAVH